MAECIDIGSYIVTIIVMTHGNVIELDVMPKKQIILENVIFLSLAADFLGIFDKNSSPPILVILVLFGFTFLFIMYILKLQRHFIIIHFYLYSPTFSLH